jgi:hypothetical protein
VTVLLAFLVFIGTFLALYDAFHTWKFNLVPTPRVRLVEQARTSIAEVVDVETSTTAVEQAPPAPPTPTPGPDHPHRGEYGWRRRVHTPHAAHG